MQENRLTGVPELKSSVLALRITPTEIGATHPVTVWRLDHCLVFRFDPTEVVCIHRVVCVGGSPIDTDDILRFTLAVGHLTCFLVLGDFESTVDPAVDADAHRPAEATTYPPEGKRMNLKRAKGTTYLQPQSRRSRSRRSRCSRCCRSAACICSSGEAEKHRIKLETADAL